jgi:hypothetical protein
MVVHIRVGKGRKDWFCEMQSCVMALIRKSVLRHLRGKRYGPQPRRRLVEQREHKGAILGPAHRDVRINGQGVLAQLQLETRRDIS